MLEPADMEYTPRDTTGWPLGRRADLDPGVAPTIEMLARISVLLYFARRAVEPTTISDVIIETIRLAPIEIKQAAAAELCGLNEFALPDHFQVELDLRMAISPRDLISDILYQVVLLRCCLDPRAEAAYFEELQLMVLTEHGQYMRAMHPRDIEPRLLDDIIADYSPD